MPETPLEAFQYNRYNPHSLGPGRASSKCLDPLCKIQVDQRSGSTSYHIQIYKPRANYVMLEA